MRRLQYSILMLSAMALLCVALAQTHAQPGRGASTGVLPPGASFRGATLAQWSERHWQWAFSLPTDAHPLFDTAPPDAGQHENVFFIGGNFVAEQVAEGYLLAEADRACTIAPGTALFFPIFNAEASVVEEYGTTPEELLAAADFLADLIVPETLYLTIDGVEVQNLVAYRAPSDVFVVGPVPEENLFDFYNYPSPEGTTSDVAADGYYVMIKPLSPGVHTIEFGGILDANDLFGLTVEQNTTYTITVSR